MSCNTKKCKARCCYNIPFSNHELDVYLDMIVNPIIEKAPFPDGSYLAVTDYDPLKNKCPFLRKDYKCNIYHNRPEVCRLMGNIPELKCKFYSK